MLVTVKKNERKVKNWNIILRLQEIAAPSCWKREMYLRIANGDQCRKWKVGIRIVYLMYAIKDVIPY